MSKNKLKIAITGNIGSGKSSFSKFIEEEGFTVINADDLSKIILSNDPAVKEKVIKEFGKESYQNEKLNKTYLAEKVFSNKQNLTHLESILHPMVINKSVELMESFLKNKDIIFLEAALIYEADMENLFDFVILITADRELRFQRKKKSDGYTEEQFVERENMQIPQDEKRKRADFIFENNSDLKSLKQKAKLLFILLNKPDPDKGLNLKPAD
ncbi:MAG TPA: dephospho-CoA kinase [Ignavibacteriaceae bacterium]|nr:dephospho-CoA kinase [Ignavibacteriaceae bacterium]